jgi:mono/diheme cytochrome c family protein
VIQLARNIMTRPTTLAAFALLVAATGCRKVEMHDQERKDPYEVSDLFADGTSSRALIAGTVARGAARTDQAMYNGVGPDGRAVTEFPWKMTESDIRQGQQQYQIYCYVCHGGTGAGDGMIVKRGFPRPQSFHSQRLKDAPVGYYYQVITNGFGAMYSYAERVTPEDRWRVAAYVRTLQIAQSQRYANLTDEQKKAVEESTKPATQPVAAEAEPKSH